MSTVNRVLVASQNKTFVNKIQRSIAVEGLSISGMFALDELRAALEGDPADLILLHHQFSEEGGLSALQTLLGWKSDIPVLCIAPTGDVDYEIKCLDLGAKATLVEWGEYHRKLPLVMDEVVKNHRLEQAYQQAQEKIHSQALLLDYVQDAVVAWNTRGEITYSNFSARSLFMIEGNSWQGKSAEEKYFPLFDPHVRIPTEEGTKEFRQERQFIKPDGSVVWVSSRISYIYDPLDKQKIIGFMDISRDITEQKRLNREMQKAREKTAQSERLAELGELASGVAHQVNNPLTTIIAETQLAQRQLALDHPARDSIQAVEEAGWKAQQAVSHLLEFTRAPKISYRTVSVNTIIHRSLSAIYKLQPVFKGVVNIQLTHNLPDINGNPFQLEDLWVKLILGKQGDLERGLIQSIWVKTTIWEDHGVRVDVMDDGPPLSPREQETFFEPDYYRPESEPVGGLNYSICREIVRQHKGEIQVLNQGNVGRIIKVLLPGG